MKRTLLATSAALTLLAAPLAGTASADGAAFRDPAGDALATIDVTSYFLALNSEVVSANVTLRGYNASQFAAAEVYADLDTNSVDDDIEFSLYKPPGVTTAVLLDGDDAEVPGCAVQVTAGPGSPTVTMSTTAACIGSPRSVAVSWALFLGDEDVELAPDVEAFSGRVSRGADLRGPIGDKYAALGGSSGTLGAALTDATETTRGGSYALFQRGAVYATPTTGAHFVRGDIRRAWNSYGAEYSGFGFPVTDEVGTAGRPGAVNVFEGGSIYWSARTGAQGMYGAILQAWAGQGYEAGRLGFPRTGEFVSPDGVKQEFEGGNIVWTAERGAVIAYPRG